MNDTKLTTSDIYKELFRRIWQLIINPEKEWDVIKNENKTFNNVLSDFALPIIGLVTVAAFIGYALKFQDFNLEYALKHTTIVFISLFASIYIIFFLLGLIMLSDGFKKNDVIALTIYSSTMWYLLSFITELIPELFFLNIFVIYNAFVIFQGAKIYMKGLSKGKIYFITTLLFITVHSFPFTMRFFLSRLIII